MALNATGPISIGGSTAGQSVNLELGRSATATSSLNDTALRTLAGIASGAISLGSFYGKSNASYGYIFGGYIISTSTLVANVDKFNLSTEVKSAISAMPQALTYATAMHSSTNAYVTGGAIVGAILATIRKMPFSTETTANIAATLDITLNNSLTLNNLSTKGYTVSGWSNLSNAESAYCGALVYASDTEAAISALPAGGAEGTGLSSPTAGYSMSVSYQNGTTGYPGYFTIYSPRNIMKLLFSTETHSTLTPFLEQRIAVGTSTTTAGYIICGSDSQGNNINSIQSFNFSTETVTYGGALTTISNLSAAGFGSSTKGYTAGGFDFFANAYISAIYAMTYPTLTLSTTGQSLSSVVIDAAGTQSGTIP